MIYMTQAYNSFYALHKRKEAPTLKPWNLRQAFPHQVPSIQTSSSPSKSLGLLLYTPQVQGSSHSNTMESPASLPPPSAKYATST